MNVTNVTALCWELAKCLRSMVQGKCRVSSVGVNGERIQEAAIERQAHYRIVMVKPLNVNHDIETEHGESKNELQDLSAEQQERRQSFGRNPGNLITREDQRQGRKRNVGGFPSELGRQRICLLRSQDKTDALHNLNERSLAILFLFAVMFKGLGQSVCKDAHQT